MLKTLYIVFGLFVIGVYAYATFTGMESRPRRRGVVPAAVRGAGGGYGVWYSGYHGGK